MEQLDTHWTDFHVIWYLSIFKTSAEKMQVPLKSDKNKGHFTWSLIYIFIISRSFLLRMKNVSDKICREIRNTHVRFNNFFFFRKSWRLWDMWKNTVERSRLQHSIACWIPKSTNTHSEYVILYCLSTASIVARTGLSVTLYAHCLSC